MFGLLLSISTFTCGLVGGLGLMSPYIGAAAGLGIGLVFNVGIVQLIALVVACYIAPLITSSVLNADGLSNSITAGGLNVEEEEVVADMSEKDKSIRGIKIGVAKVAAVGAALVMPAFKLPMITGGVVLLLAIGIIWFSRGLTLEEAIPLILNICVQTFAWVSGLALIDMLAPNTFSTMGIIAGVAIPTLLLGSTERTNKEDIERLKADMSISHPFRYMWTAGIITMMLMFPGYSSGALISTLTPNDSMRAIYSAVTEGFIEGWVLKLFLSGMTSAKTPLGDLLVASSINLSIFPAALPLIFVSVISTCVISILLIRFITPLTVITHDYSKFFLIFTLTLQSIATAGTLPFLILLSVGFLTYYLRLLISPSSQDFASLALLSPMI
jgi:hypothetical protein